MIIQIGNRLTFLPYSPVSKKTYRFLCNALGISLLLSLVVSGSCRSFDGPEIDLMFWNDTFEVSCLLFFPFLLGVDVAPGTISRSLQFSVQTRCKKHWGLFLSTLTLFLIWLSTVAYDLSFQLLGIRCSSSWVSRKETAPSSWNYFNWYLNCHFIVLWIF